MSENILIFKLNSMYHKFRYFLVAIVFIAASCNNGSFVPVHDTISLNGSWKFALDTAKTGITEKWYSHSLPDSVKLPGTLDENNKGIPNTRGWKPCGFRVKGCMPEWRGTRRVLLSLITGMGSM